MLRIGMTAPDFEILTHTGLRFRLSDHAGSKNVVLLFVPASAARQGGRELELFASHVRIIQDHDALSVGISDAPPSDLEHLAGTLGTSILLGSDENRAICRNYRVLWLRSRAIRRVTYVIDRKMIVRGVAHHELLVERHWNYVSRVLGQLKHESDIAAYNRKAFDL